MVRNGRVLVRDGPGSDRWAGLRASLLDFARWTQQQLVQADSVGVTVVVDGSSVFAASNPFGRSVDALQYGIEEGPCLTAVEMGATVRSVKIGSGEPRWTRFTPGAAQLALRSVASTPLRRHGHPGDVVGSLNLYGRSASSLDRLDEAALERVAAALRGPVNSARLLAVADVNTAILTAAHRAADQEEGR